MELLRSRKRKQPSSTSNVIAGIFTRSKSQIYLHRHRSGYARADATGNRNITHSIQRISKSVGEKQASEARADKVTGPVCVKDLRARRVFSPVSGAYEVVDAEEINSEVDRKVHKLNSPEPNLSGTDVYLEVSVANSFSPSPEITPDPSSVREDPVAEADEFVQMTPTDPGTVENKGTEGLNGTILAGNEIVTTEVSVAKSQYSVTRSCNQRKVFKTPSSFSYRRLLPYLMDIGKDDTYFSKIELVETTLPGKVQSSNNMALNLVANKDDEIGAESAGRKLVDNTRSYKESHSNCLNSNVVRTGGRLGQPDVEKTNHEVVLNELMEEYEQMTPAGADKCSKPEVDKRMDVLVKPSQNLSTGSNDSFPASKLVLNRCSRLKALQNPSSLSHRRLLPFLMKTTGDDSCASKVNQCLKLEKVTEPNPPPLMPSLVHQNSPVDKSKTKRSDGQLNAGHERPDSPAFMSIPTGNSSDEVEAVSNGLNHDSNGSDVEYELRKLDSHLEVKSLAEFKPEISMKADQQSFDNDFGCGQEANSSVVSLSPVTSLETLPTKCPIESSKFCPLYERKVVTVGTQSSQIMHFGSPGIHVEKLRNGILRRNPRGCRGLCNCLNCMSFRLHAEKAFEFSRNQMRDAEEVMQELIKDLTCLRNMLEKTAADSKHAAVDIEQVKEACAKAMHTEELAKMRLVQMNEDLSIHSRSTVSVSNTNIIRCPQNRQPCIL